MGLGLVVGGFAQLERFMRLCELRFARLACAVWAWLRSSPALAYPFLANVHLEVQSCA